MIFVLGIVLRIFAWDLTASHHGEGVRIGVPWKEAVAIDLSYAFLLLGGGLLLLAAHSLFRQLMSKPSRIDLPNQVSAMTAANFCPTENDLKALLDHSLTESKTNELSAHLENCIRCRESLDRLAAGDDWQNQVAKHLSKPGDADNGAALRAVERWKIPQRETVLDTDDLERLEFLEPSDQPGVLGMLGPYEITETIGRGGFGLVLKGRDPRLNRIVAVKVLAPEWASNATARKRFLREAQAAAAVRHDHVVTIYAVDEVARLPYLVMEYVPGKSLQERLDEQGPLEVREILRIGRQIAMGLAAAHAEGLIHRDIKPGNVLLEDGIQRVKITDFGLARAVDDIGMTQTGTVAGTPEYMSPEQAWGGVVDHRTDLFSLGGVLYAMCTGRSPFRAKSAMAVLKRVCEDQPRAIEEVNPEIPLSFVAIIERLLAKDPNQRFESAQEVADLLGTELSLLQNAETMLHLPLEAKPAPPPRPEKAPDNLRSWLADRFVCANAWRPWRRSPRKPPSPPPTESRAVRWFVMFQIGGALAFLILMTFWLLVEKFDKPDRYVSPVATRVHDEARTPTFSHANAPWSPPLLATNELTLDIADAQVQVSIDGRPYPVNAEGKRQVRLGDGEHTIAIADEGRGWFDKVSLSIPTSESYLRIDRGGILQSAVPTNVKVQWIPIDNMPLPIRFKGPDDVLVAQGYGDYQEPILAWDIKRGEAISTSHSMPPHEMMGYGESQMDVSSGNGLKTVAVTQNGRYLARASSQGHQVNLFDVESAGNSNWLRRMTVTRHAGTIQAIEFSPNGRWLFCGSPTRAELFRLDDLIATKQGEMNLGPETSGGGRGEFQSLFLPDNRHFLIATKSNDLELWKAEPLERMNVFPNQEFRWGQIHEMSADATGQRLLLTSLEKLYLFDLKQGKVLSEFDWPGNKSLRLHDAAFLPDGRHALFTVNGQTGWDGTALWIGDTQTGQVTSRLNFQDALRTNGTVQSHDFRVSPDGRRITFVCVVYSEVPRPDHNIAVVDWVIPEEAFGGEPESPVEPNPNRFEAIKAIDAPGKVASLAITPGGEQFITGGAQGSPLALHSFPGGDIIHRLKAPGDSPPASKGGFDSRVAVSPDGKRIAQGQGATLSLWDPETGERQFRVNLTDGMEYNGRSMNRVHDMRSLAFSPDGTHVLIACPKPFFSPNGQSRPYHAAFAFLVQIEKDKANIVRRFQHPEDVNAAIFLGDGRRIATACDDGRARIWQLDGTAPALELRAGGEAVLSLDATRDGAYLATGSEEGTWQLWETRFGHRLNQWTGDSAVAALKILPGENRLLTGHKDGHVALWDLSSPLESARTQAKGSLTAMALAPDGRHLLAAIESIESNPSAAIHVWAVPTAEENQSAPGENMGQ